MPFATPYQRWYSEVKVLIKPKFQRPKHGNPLSFSMIAGIDLQAYWVQSVMG